MLCAVAGIQEDDLLIKWQQANKVKAIYKPTKQASFLFSLYRRKGVFYLGYTQSNKFFIGLFI
jgi:hypothetical protein